MKEAGKRHGRHDVGTRRQEAALRRKEAEVTRYRRRQKGRGQLVGGRQQVL